MAIVIVVPLVLVVVALALVAVPGARFGRGNYQRYRGLELERGPAAEARDPCADRLKSEPDAETITEVRDIVELSEQLTSTARAGQVPDLRRSALDLLTAPLDRPRAVN